MRLGEAMKAHFAADKLNIAALGNQVAQLHVHHIARFYTDDAWPGPVWGIGSAVRIATPLSMRSWTTCAVCSSSH